MKYEALSPRDDFSTYFPVPWWELYKRTLLMEVSCGGKIHVHNFSQVMVIKWVPIYKVKFSRLEMVTLSEYTAIYVAIQKTNYKIQSTRVCNLLVPGKETSKLCFVFQRYICVNN